MTFTLIFEVVTYQDILLGVHEIRLTGRYGRTVNGKGETEFRFLFPDVEIPRSQWWTNFRETRRLNFIESIDPRDGAKNE